MHLQHAKDVNENLYQKLYAQRQIIQSSQKCKSLIDAKDSLKVIKNLHSQIVSDYLGLSDRIIQIEKLLVSEKGKAICKHTAKND